LCGNAGASVSDDNLTDIISEGLLGLFMFHLYQRHLLFPWARNFTLNG